MRPQCRMGCLHESSLRAHARVRLFSDSSMCYIRRNKNLVFVTILSQRLQISLLSFTAFYESALFMLGALST